MCWARVKAGPAFEHSGSSKSYLLDWAVLGRRSARVVAGVGGIVAVHLFCTKAAEPPPLVATATATVPVGLCLRAQVDPAAAPDGLIHTQRGLTPHAPTRPMTSNHTGSIRSSSSRGSRLRRSTAGGSCCTEVTRRQHEAVDKGGGSSERAVHISPETGAQIEMHSTAPCFFPTATQAAAAVAGGSWTTGIVL